jgi:hypothetical protein
MKTAHYFGSKAKGFFIVISDTFKPVGLTISVSGKKEALLIAREHNANPWNF